MIVYRDGRETVVCDGCNRPIDGATVNYDQVALPPGALRDRDQTTGLSVHFHGPDCEDRWHAQRARPAPNGKLVQGGEPGA